MKNEKKKGGKRAGAGRRPAEVKKEPITIYADISKFGSRDVARMAIYEFLDGKINDTGKSAFVPLDIPDELGKTSKWPPRKNKPMAALEPQEQPKTNNSIGARPRTLDELKRLCPAELEGFDRSKWIATERQKYGI